MATKKAAKKAAKPRPSRAKVKPAADEVHVKNMEVTGHFTGKVRMGRLPGTISEYEIGSGKTVKQLLHEAGISPEGHEVRVNNAIAAPEHVLGTGDIVLLVKNIRGN